MGWESVGSGLGCRQGLSFNFQVAPLLHMMSLFGKLSQTEEEAETKVDIQTEVTDRHK